MGNPALATNARQDQRTRGLGVPAEFMRGHVRAGTTRQIGVGWNGGGEDIGGGFSCEAPPGIARQTEPGSGIAGARAGPELAKGPKDAGVGEHFPVHREANLGHDGLRHFRASDG